MAILADISVCYVVYKQTQCTRWALSSYCCFCVKWRGPGYGIIIFVTESTERVVLLHPLFYSLYDYLKNFRKPLRKYLQKELSFLQIKNIYCFLTPEEQRASLWCFQLFLILTTVHLLLYENFPSSSLHHIFSDPLHLKPGSTKLLRKLPPFCFLLRIFLSSRVLSTISKSSACFLVLLFIYWMLIGSVSVSFSTVASISFFVFNSPQIFYPTRVFKILFTKLYSCSKYSCFCFPPDCYLPIWVDTVTYFELSCELNMFF